MRIVLVNWAKIWDGAASGGGVNQYCQALALELVKRGHDVISLCGGTTYARRSPTEGGVTRTGPFVLRHADWMGVRVFEIINSPVMAPSLVQFARPMGEVSSPELETVVGRLFDVLKPDAVHWNNVEGFSIGCVQRSSMPGGARSRVVFSLHNYHTICPQVYLMQQHREVCYDFDNGHNCAKCVEAMDPDEVRARKERESEPPPPPESELHKAWGEFRGSLSWAVRPFKTGYRLLGAAAGSLQAKPPAPLPPEASAESDAACNRPLPPAGDDQRGETPFLMAELDPPPPPDLTKPEYRPLLNVIQPEPPNAKPPNDYAKRRAAMVGMLAGCDRVLAVSDFVRRKFESMGVGGDVLRTMPIGSRINRVIALKPDLVFDPPPFERPPMGADSAWSPRPVRLHFMGYNHYYKGLPVVAEALEMLEPEFLRRIDLSIFALDGQSIEWMFRRLEPRLAGLKFSLGYNYHDIPWMLGGKDLTLVPSVWWDNAPQTVFESMACGVPVLGAAVGGIPDFVKDGHNGLLFRGNDRQDLARRLREVTTNPWMLTELRKNVRPPKSIEDHAVEMEGVYAGTDG